MCPALVPRRWRDRRDETRSGPLYAPRELSAPITTSRQRDFPNGLAMGCDVDRILSSDPGATLGRTKDLHQPRPETLSVRQVPVALWARSVTSEAVRRLRRQRQRIAASHGLASEEGKLHL